MNGGDLWYDEEKLHGFNYNAIHCTRYFWLLAIQQSTYLSWTLRGTSWLCLKVFLGIKLILKYLILKQILLVYFKKIHQEKKLLSLWINLDMKGLVTGMISTLRQIRIRMIYL